MTDLDPADQLVHRIQAETAVLGSPEQSDGLALTELVERLAQLHTGLQNALTELDRA